MVKLRLKRCGRKQLPISCLSNRCN
uniref:30S ribosomal protein S16, chloroplastic n=1 Tax=Fargesia denudata TaxID=1306438 RepID=A0A1W6GWY6_9POAL|nr:ribosomal protein S16 [Fargesia denudata]ARM20338.1 ribosomal protein S16 [Fargesia denudata]